MSIADNPYIVQARIEVGEPPKRPKRVWVNVLKGQPSKAGKAYLAAYQKWEIRVLERALKLIDASHQEGE